MSTEQEYWDAALIRVWRNDGQLWDVLNIFKSVTNKDAWEVEGLLRTFPKGMPRKLRIRPYMAQFLEKINSRLWDQTPDKDVLLLRKLQTSKYTTSTSPTNRDNELESARKRHINDRKRLAMNALQRSVRNQATDWGITKGGHTRRRK